LETSVDVDVPAQRPDEFRVSKAYPNPFNASFVVDVHLEKTADLTLSIYNLKGQLVQRIKPQVSQGTNQITVANLDHSILSSGVYILKVDNGSQFYTQNITYLK